VPLIPIDPQLIQPFNQAIMRLLRPSHLRDQSYVTDQYCGIISHPNGTAWPLLSLPDTETVPIHVNADGGELRQLLDIFVANNGITKEESDGIKQAVAGMVGQTVRLADMVPPSWQPYILTVEQAIDQGYIPQPEVV
jgi:hypothetical protein